MMIAVTVANMDIEETIVKVKQSKNIAREDAVIVLQLYGLDEWVDRGEVSMRCVWTEKRGIVVLLPTTMS